MPSMISYYLDLQDLNKTVMPVHMTHWLCMNQLNTILLLSQSSQSYYISKNIK
jgi:hypothetical protein